MSPPTDDIFFKYSLKKILTYSFNFENNRIINDTIPIKNFIRLEFR